MKRLYPFRVPSLLLVVALLGCSSLETRITRPEDQPTTMELLVEVPQSSSSASVVPGPSANIIVDDGQNTLSISGVDLVLDEVEFRRSSGEGCVESDDPAQDDGDSCSEVVVNPAVLALPIDQETRQAANVVIDPGTYEALEFDVHVTTESDTDIITQTPELLGASVRVRGSFNGSALDGAVFAPSGRVQLPIDPVIEAGEGSASTVTLIVDVESWFRASDGSVVDPTAAAQDPTLSQEVADRIMDSFSLRGGS